MSNTKHTNRAWLVVTIVVLLVAAMLCMVACNNLPAPDNKGEDVVTPTDKTETKTDEPTPTKPDEGQQGNATDVVASEVNVAPKSDAVVEEHTAEAVKAALDVSVAFSDGTTNASTDYEVELGAIAADGLSINVTIKANGLTKSLSLPYSGVVRLELEAVDQSVDMYTDAAAVSAKVWAVYGDGRRVQLEGAAAYEAVLDSTKEGDSTFKVSYQGLEISNPIQVTDNYGEFRDLHNAIDTLQETGVVSLRMYLNGKLDLGEEQGMKANGTAGLELLVNIWKDGKVEFCLTGSDDGKELVLVSYKDGAASVAGVGMDIGRYQQAIDAALAKIDVEAIASGLDEMLMKINEYAEAYENIAAAVGSLNVTSDTMLNLMLPAVKAVLPFEADDATIVALLQAKLTAKDGEYGIEINSKALLELAEALMNYFNAANETTVEVEAEGEIEGGMDLGGIVGEIIGDIDVGVDVGISDEQEEEGFDLFGLIRQLDTNLLGGALYQGKYTLALKAKVGAYGVDVTFACKDTESGKDYVAVGAGFALGVDAATIKTVPAITEKHNVVVEVPVDLPQKNLYLRFKAVIHTADMLSAEGKDIVTASIKLNDVEDVAVFVLNDHYVYLNLTGFVQYVSDVYNALDEEEGPELIMPKGPVLSDGEEGEEEGDVLDAPEGDEDYIAFYYAFTKGGEPASLWDMIFGDNADDDDDYFYFDSIGFSAAKSDFPVGTTVAELRRSIEYTYSLDGEDYTITDYTILNAESEEEIDVLDEVGEYCLQLGYKGYTSTFYITVYPIDVEAEVSGISLSQHTYYVPIGTEVRAWLAGVDGEVQYSYEDMRWNMPIDGFVVVSISDLQGSVLDGMSAFKSTGLYYVCVHHAMLERFVDYISVYVYNPEQLSVISVDYNGYIQLWSEDPDMVVTESMLRAKLDVSLNLDNGEEVDVENYTLTKSEEGVWSISVVSPEYGYTYEQKLNVNVSVPYIWYSWGYCDTDLPIGATEEALRAHLHVYARYSDDSEKEYYDYDIEDFDSSIAGGKSVYVRLTDDIGSYVDVRITEGASESEGESIGLSMLRFVVLDEDGEVDVMATFEALKAIFEGSEKIAGAKSILGKAMDIRNTNNGYVVRICLSDADLQEADVLAFVNRFIGIPGEEGLLDINADSLWSMYDESDERDMVDDIVYMILGVDIRDAFYKLYFTVTTEGADNGFSVTLSFGNGLKYGTYLSVGFGLYVEPSDGAQFELTEDMIENAMSFDDIGDGLMMTLQQFLMARTVNTLGGKVFTLVDADSVEEGSIQESALEVMSACSFYFQADGIVQAKATKVLGGEGEAIELDEEEQWSYGSYYIEGNQVYAGFRDGIFGEITFHFEGASLAYVDTEMGISGRFEGHVLAGEFEDIELLR